MVKKISNLVLAWFNRASSDFRVARKNLKINEYYSSIFWAQQTIEKSLKALIIKKKKEVPQTHDLYYLGKLIKLPNELLSQIAEISGDYFDTRYGIIIGEDIRKKFNKSYCQRVIDLAGEILKWTEKRI